MQGLENNSPDKDENATPTKKQDLKLAHCTDHQYSEMPTAP